MQYYVAPLEGITGYIFRNVHHRFFPGADKYFIPFIEPKPNSKKIFSSRELNDILPEHNEGMYAVPQILTNKWEDFVWTAKHLQEYGYKEVNINLGCPSKTVVSKKRGAGFLADPEGVDDFLAHIFDALDMKISVKTRLGREDPVEFRWLLEIYNKYPLSELIIHPRTQKEFYSFTPHYEMFAEALAQTALPVCYNGDVNTKEECREVEKRFPQITGVMMGRGILRNPGLIGEIRGEEKADIRRLRRFHDELYAAYRQEMSGDVQVLFKMKELWTYLRHSFVLEEKTEKKLFKAKHLREYDAAVAAVFAANAGVRI